MKRFLSICLCVIILSIPMLAMTSSHNESDITVIFKDDSSFTAQEKELIIQSFTEGNPSQMQPHGLYCLLFGHDYKSEVITVIRHKVNPAPPRCMKDYYNVQVCTRCSDTISTLISSVPIDCCS